jgi:hypothetical protein
MERYIWWVQHGENIKIVDNINNIVRDESGGDRAEDLILDNDKRDEWENQNVEI